MRLIDADALMAIVQDAGFWEPEDKQTALYLVDFSPSVDAVPVVHAHWRFARAYEVFGGDEDCWYSHGNPIAMICCSNCGFEPYVGDVCAIPQDAVEAILDYKLCPHCGAFMDE